MDIAGSSVVITGGASGIGEALAKRFLREGARQVVIADLAADALEAAAERLTGDPRLSTQICDVSSAEANAALVERCERDLDGIDLFCANAGIGSGGGIDASDDMWERVWRINTMSHVWAARALLPRWLERGKGYFLVTASAAGLLTNLGDAPYTATKAAAVAVAEWLSITYGDRGIGVSCLCPQGVRTPLVFGPDADASPGARLATAVVKAQRMLEPDDVADSVVRGLDAEQFLILPHEEVAGYVRHKATDRDRWIAAMRDIQRHITAAESDPNGDPI